MTRIQGLESKISRDNKRFEEICQNITEFFFEHDEKGLITDIIPQYVSQLGVHKDDLVGNNIKSLVMQRSQKYLSHW